MERSSVVRRLFRSQEGRINDIRTITKLHLNSFTRVYSQGGEIQRILLQFFQFLIHFLHC